MSTQRNEVEGSSGSYPVLVDRFYVPWQIGLHSSRRTVRVITAKLGHIHLI